MKNKSNFNRAMYDMFGVGADDNEELENVQEAPAPEVKPVRPVSEPANEPVYAEQETTMGYQAVDEYESNSYTANNYAPNGYAAGGYASDPYASASTATVDNSYGSDPYAGAAASNYTAPAPEPTPASTSVVPVSSGSSGAAYSAAPYVLVPATYLAPGTEFEGHFKSKGDVEIAGKFIGDLESEGDVTLRTSMEGNITAANLSILDGALKGDCHVTNRLQINVGSSVEGNVFANDLMCSGSITGDSEVKGNSSFDATADVEGNITTGTMSMERGCSISGTLTMKGTRR